MAQKYDIAIISGYFDPIHKGHLEYIEKSKKFAKKLIVILNNNFQTKLKKKKFFLDEKERKEILQSNKNVDEVFISLDKDKSVCKTIEKIASKNKNKKIVFANGGDRKNYEIPESKICKKLNIHIKDRIGKKIQSSSSLIKKAKYLEIGKRPWGKYFVLEEGKNFKVKRIEVKPKSKLSLQSHNLRQEHWIVVEGVADLVVGNKKVRRKKGEYIFVKQKQKHRIENNTKNILQIIEVQNGNYLGEDDIIRYSDIYNRK